MIESLVGVIFPQLGFRISIVIAFGLPNHEFNVELFVQTFALLRGCCTCGEMCHNMCHNMFHQFFTGFVQVFS